MKLLPSTSQTCRGENNTEYRPVFESNSLGLSSGNLKNGTTNFQAAKAGIAPG
jgi:hypothetical protein